MTSAMARPVGKARIGLWTSIALVIGNMIGSGVFLLPASLASYGGVSVVGWLVTAVGAIALALVFWRLSRAFPRIGGPYAYTYHGFGGAIGFQVAWGYWIAIWAGNAAIVTAFVGYLGEFWPGLTGSPVLAAAVAIIAVWVLTAVNAAGIRPAGVVQVITTIAKLIPLVAVALLGLFFFDSANFPAFNPSGESNFSAVTSVAALTLWAFIGLESSTIPADDVENPERTIPRATIIGTLITTVIYILGTVAVMGLVPAEQLASSTAPFADAARAMFGSWAGYVVAIGALFSTFGCLNGWILLQGQIPLAAAKDGLFPAAFGRVSANGTPVFGLVVSSILVTLLILFNYNSTLVELFNFTLLLATMTTLVPYVFTTMAALVLYATDRTHFKEKPGAGEVLIALVAFVYSMWTLYGAGAEVVMWGTLLMLAGLPIYVWMKSQSPAAGGKAAATSGR